MSVRPRHWLIVGVGVCAVLFVLYRAVDFDRYERQETQILAGEKRTMATGSGAVMRIAYSPNGKYLAAGTTEGDLTVWDNADGHVVAAFTTKFVRSLAFSPDNRLLASTAGCVQLWD